MSVRYGIALIPDPTFAARVYRTRQLVCGQYGAWAAEMHMLHLTLADFFRCEDGALEEIDAGLAHIAERSRRRGVRFPMVSRGVSTFGNTQSNIHLDFTVSENPRDSNQRQLMLLHEEVICLLEHTEGSVPALQFARENYVPHITLMQHADLPPAVFDSAVDYAKAVLRDLSVPHGTRAWRMVFVRFESDAAGDDWDNGRWAPDLRWQLLNAFPL